MEKAVFSLIIQVSYLLIESRCGGITIEVLAGARENHRIFYTQAWSFLDIHVKIVFSVDNEPPSTGACVS